MRNSYFLVLILIILVIKAQAQKQIDTGSSKFSRFEQDVYKKINDRNAIAPIWFKQTTKESLSDAVADIWRGHFYSPLIQTLSNFRLLALFLLFYPLICYLCLTRKWTIWSYYWPLTGIVLLLGTFFFSKLLAMLIKLGIFAIIGNDKYVPSEFIFFCLVSIEITIIFVLTITPLYKIIKSGSTLFKKFLGWFGLIIDIIGFVFTMIEIYKLFF